MLSCLVLASECRYALVNIRITRRSVSQECALLHASVVCLRCAVNAAEAVSGLDRLEGRLAAPSTHVCQVRGWCSWVVAYGLIDCYP